MSRSILATISSCKKNVIRNLFLSLSQIHFLFLTSFLIMPLRASGLRLATQDFPCSPVVKISPSTAVDMSSIPGQETNSPHVAWCGQKWKKEIATLGERNPLCHISFSTILKLFIGLVWVTHMSCGERTNHSTQGREYTGQVSGSQEGTRLTKILWTEMDGEARLFLKSGKRETMDLTDSSPQPSDGVPSTPPL